MQVEFITLYRGFKIFCSPLFPLSCTLLADISVSPVFEGPLQTATGKQIEESRDIYIGKEAGKLCSGCTANRDCHPLALRLLFLYRT